MIRQETIRDKDYNIIETIDNDIHIKYDTNGDIVWYKKNKFEFRLNYDVTSPEEQDFVDIIKDSVIKIDEVKYPNSILLSKNDKLIFKYVLTTSEIWFSYDSIWSIFEIKYLSYRNSSLLGKFMVDMAKKHLTCKGISCLNNGRNIIVEKHFSKTESSIEYVLLKNTE